MRQITNDNIVKHSCNNVKHVSIKEVMLVVKHCTLINSVCTKFAENTAFLLNFYSLLHPSSWYALDNTQYDSYITTDIPKECLSVSWLKCPTELAHLERRNLLVFIVNF